MSCKENEKLTTSTNGLELIKHFEGFKATAYFCPAHKPTIGYGHTGNDVTEADVNVKTITQAEAEALLRADLKIAENGVKSHCNVPLTQCQFDALVSFTYNLGAGNLKSSTLLKMLNASDFTGAEAQFPRWCKSGGKTVDGLLRRRHAEAALFAGNDNWHSFLAPQTQN
ncbi:MAG: lysozyme [Proteobacteria bacterium]|uniref:Lysozyme n=1 Tax=Candidatus Avisuccinivibrio stercorigallinarum TaxID=2840704 RepID=A0A9D9DAW1_9GAMM|nr:lysozyme [Candidatus Avisuccinivibrio stercorigallinarum]